MIFNDVIKGWEYSTVDIAADKLVVGLIKALKGEDIGMIRIYRMNSPSYEGHRYERCGRDTHLPIHPQEPQDAPSILKLSKDGNSVSCGTPRFGYYFAWDISRRGEPCLLTSCQLKNFQGPDAESLTGVTLFPDVRHLLISTFPMHNPKSTTPATHFTQALYPPYAQRPIRQVSARTVYSCVSPHGSAAAFLSKSGNVWITPMTRLESDDNLTSLACVKSNDRLHPLDSGGGTLAFSATGDRLVCADRRGKLLVLVFPVRGSPPPPPPPPPPLAVPVGTSSAGPGTGVGTPLSLYAADLAELLPGVSSPKPWMKAEGGGCF